MKNFRPCGAWEISQRISENPYTGQGVVLSGALGGGRAAHRERVLMRRRSGSVPGALATDSILNYGRDRARVDALVALVTTPRIVRSTRRAKAMSEG